MTAGKLSKAELLEEYYTSLHRAYNAMWQAFKRSRLSQDEIAEKLGVDKALISKRLRGRDNLTLKTLSFMATAVGCRLTVDYTPYEHVATKVQTIMPTAKWREIPLATVMTTGNVAYRELQQQEAA